MTLKEKQNLRTGYTTGTCAAAAAKAALLVLQGEEPQVVEVETPQHEWLTVPIKSVQKNGYRACACVQKDSGDDPDITNRAEIWAEAVICNNHTAIKIGAGQGIGIVTKPGLSVQVGEAAINPGPRWMIEQAARSVLPLDQGADIVISIPVGEQLARHTLNPMLGIEGGLSILGTTGVVHPMSEDAWKSSLVPQISVVKALGHEDIVFVPGKIGENLAVNTFGLPAEQVAQTSNFIGYMLEKAVELGIKRVLLFGHIGKIIKIAGGIFHTHSKMADARQEIMAAYLGSIGADAKIIRQILQCVTTEAAMPIIAENNLTSVYNIIAQRATIRAERYIFGELTVGTVMVTLKGELLGYDEHARQIGGSLGWKVKS